MDLSKFSETRPPIDPAAFQQIGYVSLLLGFSATALFVVHQAIGNKHTRNVSRDISIALFAAVALGAGLVFGLLSMGVWI